MKKWQTLVLPLIVFFLMAIIPISVSHEVFANPGWESPTGFSDPSSTWTSESLAYDLDTGTYAYTTVPKGGWSGYLELNIVALDCDKVRGWFDIGSVNVNDFELDVYYSGGWQNIHSGLPALAQYVEFPIGSTQSVTGMRFRFYSTKLDADGGQCYEVGFWEVAGVSAPTITTSVATNIEATTATLNGNVTDTGGEDPTVTVYWGDEDGGTTPSSWDYNSVPTSPGQPQGVASFYKDAISLPAGTTVFFSAKATNSGGTGWGTTQSFLTKPATPTSVSATDGSSTDNVTITWAKSTGATDYQVYRDGTPLGWAGDVATFDDVGANAPTITPGNTIAPDGSSTSNVSLSLSGTSANKGTTHTYKVRAKNATGESADSDTDNGYRGVGSLTYQWQRSAGDSDDTYSNISGATSATYDDIDAPAPTITPGVADASDNTSMAYVELSLSGQTANVGTGRYYQCILNATGATEQSSVSNRGYRGVGSLTYQWQRSSGDSDADYSNIVGAVTESYDDTGAPENGDGRYYRCIENAEGASEQTSTSDRGCRATSLPEGSPTITTLNAVVAGITAVLSGNITDTDDGNCVAVGFVWDTVSRAYPGNVAPSASAYANSWEKSGSYPVGEFSHKIVGLTELTVYYFRPAAKSTLLEWGYGDEFEFFVGEEGKVYLEFRPDLDETYIRGQGGIPTDANVGEFYGYSLPVWADDEEELHYVFCVPDRWDGESQILVHVVYCLSLANQADRSNRWELLWEHFTPNVDVVPATTNEVNFQRYFTSNNQYESYRDYLVIDYDIDVNDPIETDDLVAICLRRETTTPEGTDADELIVLAIDILFARGDLLGDPESVITEADMEDVGISLFMLVLALLALGMTIAMFATKSAMLGFPSAIFWAVLMAYAYTQSTTAWVDWQYYLFFASFGMVVFCAIAAFGLREPRDTLADESMAKEDVKEAESYVDEEVDPFESRDKSEQSERTKGIRGRAKQRKTPTK